MALKRALADQQLNPVGLGCMGLSHAYGVPLSIDEGRAVLLGALESGVDHFDCAALYGFGKNEKLLGSVLKPFRDDIFLVTKGGMRGVDGVRVIDGRPETIIATCEESLRNLQTDIIDLYYLHRVDKKVPVEDSIGALLKLKEQGKIKAIGLSEVSADTLRKVHAIHPIAAVQSEYSLWSRNAEIAVLKACEELGIAFVAFSPVARGFLADLSLDPDNFAEKDIRRGMPRFQAEHFSKNATLCSRYAQIASDAACTPAQLALAWLLQKSPAIHAIPGTTSLKHLKENVDAASITLAPDTVFEVETLINQSTISGPRYPAATQAEIDSEQFEIELSV